MSFFVYMILTKHKGKKISYVGYTKNLYKRLSEHNLSKGAKFTKGKKWELIYYKEYKLKRIAMKEEYILKKNIKLRNEIKKKYLKK